jgi:ribosomal protein L11 methyltransferase
MISDTPSRGPATSVARLETDEQSARRIADLLIESYNADEVAVTLSGAGGDLWHVAIHFRGIPDEDAVRALATPIIGSEEAAALRFEHVAAKDWIGASLAGLKPVVAGRFTVHGAHDRSNIPANRIGIEIEAALAFGTGHHGTTRGCLLALERLCAAAPTHKRPRRILDLGTGSGVLAIAAARAWHRRVLATDIDGSAVRVARANARFNRAGALVEVIKADGVADRRVRARAPFDLIFANILLGPLQRLAAPLSRLAAPGGRVILSGLLSSQTNAALAAYHALTLERRIDLDGWTTLVLARRMRLCPAVARRPRRP